MEVASLAGTLVLAVVFASAGVAKLADLRGSRDAVAGFGIPGRLAPTVGTLLPVVELVAAALLAGGALAADLAHVGALLAVAMVALFSAAIVLSLARGRAPECHCFGQLHSTPAGPRTLARNGALLVIAAFVASAGDIGLTAAAGITAIVTVALAGLLQRRRVELREQLGHEGLPIGSQAPGFDLPALAGTPLSLAELLRRERPVLLVFTDPDCGPCIALAPEIAAWQRDHADRVTIAAIERGDGRAQAAPDDHGRRDVLLQRDREVAGAYRAVGTPSAVLVDTDGRIASGVAAGRPAIEALLARAIPGVERPVSTVAVRSDPVPLARRELLARAAAAWAAVMGLIAAPAWASTGQLERKCRYERCGDRCCPKRAKCRKRGGRRVCICPDGRRACRDRCCPETFVCRRRGGRRRKRCVCPRGHIVCSGRCVRPRTDPRHCGRCGRECPVGTSCVDGGCVEGDGSGTGPGGSGACDCPPGKACCEGRCTDLNESDDHCGDCGQTCVGGRTCCDGHCKDLESDHKNCGRCGRRCGDNEVCSGGECRRRCRRGLKNCRGDCVDTTSNRDHCGGCGRKCNGPFDTGECCNGKCCDINGSTCCPGGCKNLALDDDNCGECGNACPSGSFCRFGTCTAPP